MENYNKYQFILNGNRIIINLNGSCVISYDTVSKRYHPGFAGNDHEKMLLDIYLSGVESANKNVLDPYYIHIMTNLGLAEGILDKEGDDADDEIWDAGKALYTEFLNSKYNDDNISEYDCIVDFLKHYQKIHYELWDNRNNSMLQNTDDLIEIQDFLINIRAVGGKTKENILTAIKAENMGLLHENIKHLGYRVLKIDN